MCIRSIPSNSAQSVASANASALPELCHLAMLAARITASVATALSLIVLLATHAPEAAVATVVFGIVTVILFIIDSSTSGSADSPPPGSPSTPPLTAAVHSAMSGSSIHDDAFLDNFALPARATVRPLRRSNSSTFGQSSSFGLSSGFGLEEKESIFTRGSLRERTLDMNPSGSAFVHPSLLSSSSSLSLPPLPPAALGGDFDLAARGNLRSRTLDSMPSLQSSSSASVAALPVSSSVDLAERGDLRSRTVDSAAAPIASIASASSSVLSPLLSQSPASDLAARGPLHTREEDSESMAPPAAVPAREKRQKRKAAPAQSEPLPWPAVPAAALSSARVTRGQLRQRDTQVAQSQPTPEAAQSEVPSVAIPLPANAQPVDAAARGTLRRRG